MGSGPGSTAPLSAAGLGQVSSAGNVVEVESFIKRVVESLQGHVVDQSRLGQFASTWMYKARQVGSDQFRLSPIYNDMVSEIRRDAQTPGSWVATGGASAGMGSGPGSTAPLSATGLGQVSSAGNVVEVESFIKR